jgi:hypothetical protein
MANQNVDTANFTRGKHAWYEVNTDFHSSASAAVILYTRIKNLIIINMFA